MNDVMWSGVRLLLLVVLQAGLMAVVGGIDETRRYRKDYINSWAVEVVGGNQVANIVAGNHGFTNIGQIAGVK